MQPLTVPGRLDSLPKIGKYTMLAAADAGLEKSRTYKLRLAVDEIATNIINYGYQQAGLNGDITVSADLDDHALTIMLDDASGYFDPTMKPPPPPEDFSKPLEERGVGGWGVYLALQSVDQFHYHRHENHNHNIFVMNRATHGNLLLIDSSKDECTDISDYLVSLGYSVACVKDAQSGVEQMQRQKPEMVLIDLPMRDRNADEFIKDLKADNALRGIPIIVLVSSDQLSDAEKCISSGAEDYIVLPYSQVVLKARLSVNLERHRVRLSERNLTEMNNNDRDVQIGQQIQRSFFPETLPQLPGWELAARFDPAREVAGDFYDSFRLSDGHVSVIMGDVCDKGITAALFMALFRSLLRAFSQQDHSTSASGELIANTLRLTNDYIQNNHNSANMFATIFFGILKPDAGELFYVNAGQEAPLILNPGGIKARLKPSEVAVGMAADAQYEVHQTRLDPGDTLMLFTDGVFGAKNPAGQVYGRERLLDLITKSDLTPASLLGTIETDLRSFISEATLIDDITMLAIRRSA